MNLNLILIKLIKYIIDCNSNHYLQVKSRDQSVLSFWTGCKNKTFPVTTRPVYRDWSLDTGYADKPTDLPQNGGTGQDRRKQFRYV